MLFAVIMMNAFGVSGNLMSLGALDFGLIVDGAVIIVEAVIHRLHGNVNFRGVMRLSQTEMDDEVMKTSSRMMRSAVFGQLVILVVYLPIFTLEGIEGKMFKPMAQTVVFALLGAFLLSLTYIPMMSALFLDRKTGASHSFVERWFSKLEAFYIQTLNFLMRFPLRMALAALILFSGACWKLFTMGGEFIPQLEEGDFAVDTRVLSGSSLNTTVASTQQTAGLLKARFPEVIKVVTKIGSGEIPTDPMPMEASDMMVILKPKKEWTSAKTFPELAEKMSEALNEVPGVTAGFQFPVQMRFNELMTGARQDVVIKIFGDNLDSLAAYADRLGRLAGRVSGIRDVYVEKVTGLPQIVIRHNREALRRYDVSVASVNRVIRAAFAGETAGQMYEGDQRYDLTVTLQKPVQQNLDDIGNTPVMTGNGQLVPLRTLATIAVEVGPNQIQRENTKRRIVVGFNVRGRDVQSVVQDIRIEMTNHLRMAPGYYVAVGGAFENLEKAKWRLAIAVPVAMLLIFALLYFAFHSLQLSVLIFTAVPLSAIGGVLGLTLRDMPFSISAGVGFIALFGVAVLNGIVLIAEFERLKKSGIEDLEEIVKTGGRARLRPVLMTAAVASLGFLPMALSNGAGAEVQRPLASVVIGGLVVATFLTLVLLPSLYIYIHRVRFFGMQQAAAVSLLLIALMLPGAMQAQPLGLSDALRLAKAQYPGLKAQEYRETLARQQQKAAFSAPNAEVSVEYGKLNTDLNDTRLQLQQRFPLPTITAARRKMAASTVAERRLEYMTTGAALTRDVTRAYVMLVLEKRRLTEAESFDKALTMALEKTRVRHRTGEATTAELAAMETQVVQHRQAMSRIKMDTAAFARRLRFYTGLQHVSELSDSTAAFSFAELRENQVTLQEKLLQQREKTAKSEINLEKARWAPDVRVGWAAMTFAGMPDKNGRVLDRSDYFSAFMVGLDIPLLAHVRARDVAQAKTRAKITAAETDEQKALLKMQKAQVLLELQEIGQQLEVYYTTVKPAVEQSQRSLQNQLDSGLLSVMEWGYLAQQNWLGRALYFDLWRAYQEAATEWIFLNTTDDGLKN
jgi:cobalt-zinc-cadmium resistance protein CzcA